MTTKTRKTATVKAKATDHKCFCGCGGVITSKARFLMGHDAKLKSRLIGEAIAGSRKSEAEIAKLGWTAFLVKSRNNRAAKAKASA